VSASGQHVLVVDDEPQIVRALRVILRAEGYRVTEAATKSEALGAVSVHPPDAIVLDLLLPDGSGVEVAEEVRRWADIPIIVLSAVGDEREKVRALDVGADDYVTKPFNTEEFMARLRAVLRRAVDGGVEPVVRVGDLEVDLADRRVARGGQEVHLTPIEFDLLAVLARHPGKLVTHRQLLREVWGPAYGTETHYLRVHVAHMRTKLEPDPARPRFLITEPGVGYRLREPGPAQPPVTS
jgi:two-component system, OmpR family, KDP operon response regulator KdpE